MIHTEGSIRILLSVRCTYLCLPLTTCDATYITCYQGRNWKMGLQRTIFMYIHAYEIHLYILLIMNIQQSALMQIFTQCCCHKLCLTCCCLHRRTVRRCCNAPGHGAPQGAAPRPQPLPGPDGAACPGPASRHTSLQTQQRLLLWWLAVNEY